MFERFTEHAREAVVQAQAEARALRHNYIGTEHLLLGVARVEEASGAAALDRVGFDLAQARRDVERIIGTGPADGDLSSSDAEALRAIGIDLDEVRRLAEEAFGPGALAEGAGVPPRRRSRRRGLGRRLGARQKCAEPTPGRIPFTPRSKRVLELALREAVRLGSDHIGTEHVLLGIVREGRGVAMEILQAQGVTAEAVRGAVASDQGFGRRAAE
jgi:ATP-dependent Clp protease ATP-binding subunit ClpA